MLYLRPFDLLLTQPITQMCQTDIPSIMSVATVGPASCLSVDRGVDDEGIQPFLRQLHTRTRGH